MMKLQKDFIRDMAENFKSLVQDLEVATGLESSQDVRNLQEEMLEKSKKDSTQDKIFEIFYKILHPKIED